MARARNIKPGFFRNAELVELPYETRLLFPGLWIIADREGRLEDRPKQIKMEIFPADMLDIDDMLEQLSNAGLIKRYEINDKKYIEVVNFKKHQNPHIKEPVSTIPAPCANKISTVQAPVHNDAEIVQAGLIPDSLIPDSLIPIKNTSATPNGFAEFWIAYPKKKSKGDAEKVWKRIKPDLQTVLSAIERAKTSADWLKEQGQYIPHPATWLNARGWEDEIVTVAQTSSGFKPWILSASGIEQEAQRRGIERIEGELFPSFKHRVYQAAGVTDDMVRHAQQEAA